MNTINLQELMNQIKKIDKADLQKVLDCCMKITSIKSGITCDISYLLQLADYSTVKEIDDFIEEKELTIKKFALILIGAIKLIKNKDKNYRLKHLLDDSKNCQSEKNEELKKQGKTTTWGTPTPHPNDRKRADTFNPFID